MKKGDKVIFTEAYGKPDAFTFELVERRETPIGEQGWTLRTPSGDVTSVAFPDQMLKVLS